MIGITQAGLAVVAWFTVFGAIIGGLDTGAAWGLLVGLTMLILIEASGDAPRKR